MDLQLSIGTRRYRHDRRSMIDRAILIVAQAKRQGHTIEIDAEAENLLNQYPLCEMSFEELRSDIALIAARTQASVNQIVLQT